jgi:hypothetical protein
VSATKVILNETFAINHKYRVVLYIVKVPVSEKFPEGKKARFVLLHVDGYPRLLVDNHEPFGFHMHTQLPDDHGVRLELLVIDHDEALNIFLREVERIIANEDH